MLEAYKITADVTCKKKKPPFHQELRNMAKEKKANPGNPGITGHMYLWTMIEAAVGLMCACFPALWPLIKGFVEKRTGLSSSSGAARLYAYPPPANGILTTTTIVTNKVDGGRGNGENTGEGSSDHGDSGSSKNLVGASVREQQQQRTPTPPEWGWVGTTCTVGPGRSGSKRLHPAADVEAGRSTETFDRKSNYSVAVSVKGGRG